MGRQIPQIFLDVTLEPCSCRTMGETLSIVGDVLSAAGESVVRGPERLRIRRRPDDISLLSRSAYCRDQWDRLIGDRGKSLSLRYIKTCRHRGRHSGRHSGRQSFRSCIESK